LLDFGLNGKSQLQEPVSLFWQGFENLATHQNKVDVLLAFFLHYSSLALTKAAIPNSKLDSSENLTPRGLYNS
jgi:hypothetical protein